MNFKSGFQVHTNLKWTAITGNHILKQDIRVAPQNEASYLFSGLLFCGDCGKNLVRNGVKQNGRDYSYYICVASKGDKTCSSHRISDVKLEEAVLQVLQQHIASLMDMEQMLEFVNELPIKRDGLSAVYFLMASLKAPTSCPCFARGVNYPCPILDAFTLCQVNFVHYSSFRLVLWTN